MSVEGIHPASAILCRDLMDLRILSAWHLIFRSNFGSSKCRRFILSSFFEALLFRGWSYLLDNVFLLSNLPFLKY